MDLDEAKKLFVPHFGKRIRVKHWRSAEEWTYLFIPVDLTNTSYGITARILWTRIGEPNWPWESSEVNIHSYVWEDIYDPDNS